MLLTSDVTQWQNTSNLLYKSETRSKVQLISVQPALFWSNLFWVSVNNFLVTRLVRSQGQNSAWFFKFLVVIFFTLLLFLDLCSRFLVKDRVLIYARVRITMSGEVAVNEISYNQRPPHSPAISPARDHNQASNNEVSSEISFLIAKMYSF